MSKIVAAHQPNFIPWFPFFYKMAMSDIFIILKEVQFDKNNYQNRYLLSSGKWVTKSVKKGIGKIIGKKYSDGEDLFILNMTWIQAIKSTLGIKTAIAYDAPTELKGTDRLIALVKWNGGDTYLTNPEAKDKYLDENLMKLAGINIEYCNTPKHLQLPIFEAFEKFGIDGCIKQLAKRKHAEPLPVFQFSK